MRRSIIIIILCIALTLSGCVRPKNTAPMKTELPHLPTPTIDISGASIIQPDGMTIQERFDVPISYNRRDVEEGSFAEYLRNLPLKPYGEKVQYYDGNIKEQGDVYLSVVDMSVSDKDLQQCADAIMRLRAEYLYEKGDFDAIHFDFTNGFRSDYSKWMEGYRPYVDDNSVTYTLGHEPSNTYEDFREYLEQVFIYAGTLSLSKELKPVNIADMAIGDVLIQGGSPGHAVIVVDMAHNEKTAEICYMLAQSYMPAQDIQILQNPSNPHSPWYNLEDAGEIVTPEWIFTVNDLKRFEP